MALPASHATSLTLERGPSITPETFEAAFMAKPDKYCQFYETAKNYPIRREFIQIIHEVLRNEDPGLLGGSLIRAMVRANQISVAEAVKEIWSYVDAEVETDAVMRRDPITGPLWERFQDIVRDR